jgi:hypothetical protein
MQSLRGYAAVLITVAVLYLIFTNFYEPQREVSMMIGHANRIYWALSDYAKKNNGSYPNGESSTEVFQKLIDDGDIRGDEVFFDLPGKSVATSPRLNSSNVCYDFTKGANANSPGWLPIVYPTGYSIDFAKGQATRLPSNEIRQDIIKIVYSHDLRVFRTTSYKFYFLRTWINQIEVMPDKPVGADVSAYTQLTP